LFQRFFRHFSYLTLEQAIEYFAIFGGVEESVTLGFFDDTLSMVQVNFIEQIEASQSLVSLSFLMESPYRELLIATARGDGKLYNIIRKAKLCESVGEKIIAELIDLGVLKVEKSRENPLRLYSKQKIKKDLRTYRIQNKLRFQTPFLRFWFGFVEPYKEAIQKGKSELFLDNFINHYERLRSLVYEQLCNDLLVPYYQNRQTTLLSLGSYWDHCSEFDILAVSAEHKIILGECKYKDRKVCKNELNKLILKATQSQIPVDTYALFSKSGFSNELLQQQNDRLLLFDLNDLKMLVE